MMGISPEIKKSLKDNRIVLSVAGLIFLLFVYFLFKTNELEVRIYAEKARTKLFLVSVEALSADENKHNISIVTRQMIMADQSAAIELNELPGNTKKLTLWIIHPEYRHSRIEAPVPAMFGFTRGIRIAPISWQREIATGVADYDEVMAHLRRLRQLYVQRLSASEKKAFIRSMTVLNKVVLAANNSLRPHDILKADLEKKRKALTKVFNQLVSTINK